MSGAVFIVTVPKAEYEEKLKQETTTEESEKSQNETDASTSDINEKGNSKIKIIYSTDDETIKKCNDDCKHNENCTKSVTFKQTTNDAKKQEDGKDASKLFNSGNMPAELVVSNVLKAINVTDAAWSLTKEETHYQIIFSVHSRAKWENALHTLRDAGIGTRTHTTFSVLPCPLNYKPENTSNSNIKENGSSSWSAFVRSVRARQTVHQVIQQIKNDATITFDFLSLLVVAGIVAAMGLMESNTTFLVASMLISPLMGPITAGTFGTAIRNRDLIKTGVINELLGLAITMIIGFLFGVIVCAIDESYGKERWPTEEMIARCDTRSLWVGVLVAIPSGAAVAISILSDNTASLVGVAISASLLPPAVNAGVLWGVSLVYLFYDDDTKIYKNIRDPIYSDNQSIELAINGSISLCLTLVNIVCIYIAGIIVYMIKEVAPVNSLDEEFWKHDLKFARDFNKTVTSETNTINEENIKNEMENSLVIPPEGINYMGDDYMSKRTPNRKVSVRELQGLHKQFNEDSNILKSK